ncbi:MAG: DUF4337 family protein, partial [Xanthobacteraceae bacterium]
SQTWRRPLGRSRTALLGTDQFRVRTGNRCYESDPKTGEGRKELAVRAKAEEEERDLAMAKYHHYELASAAFQIGIVLASAAVITEVIGLAWFAGVLGLAGIAVTALGLFAPHAVEHFL